MWMKRHFEQPEGLTGQETHEERRAAFKGAKLSHVEVLNAKDDQNFSPKIVMKGMVEGWLTMAGDKITILAKPENVVYDVIRKPGAYCCHCGEELEQGEAFNEDGSKTTPGATHVKQKHAGATSPDPNWPAGYKVENHYTCKRQG